ncbi:MAG: hypothetical protein HY279_07620, partial [Nitrospinae bacterium]|nr:hypothetical protein [Nitrospinota bacterium]
KDAHKKDAHKKDAHKKDAHKKDAHKKDAHKKDAHKKDAHKKDTHKKDTHKKDTHKKDTHLSPLSPINKNLRENILKRIKKYFPDTNFPEDMPTEKLDYLLFKIEEGKINPERIKIPTAYCNAISITEEFPDFRERERQKAEIENAKREKEKIEKEERENIDWEENLRSCRKLQQELSN